MSFIVNPGSVLPPSPLIATSPDGVLTATLDTGHSGAQLWADFTILGSTSAIVAVNIYRDGVNGYELIRSGAPASAVSGQALAYDHFLTLGQNNTWYAEAIDADGNVIYTSELVSLSVPSQVMTTEVWIKSVDNPSLSIVLKAVSDIPVVSYGARQNFSEVLGNPFTVGSWDTWNAPNTEWTFLIETTEERKQLVDCLQSGVLFIQPHPNLDIDDFYALSGDITRTYGGNATQVDQLVEVSFTSVEQPAVEDSPLMSPGRTWGDVKTYYADWTAVQSAFDTWLAVAGLPIED